MPTLIRSRLRSSASRDTTAPNVEGHVVAAPNMMVIADQKAGKMSTPGRITELLPI
jgi:hypothetical protein